jgi:hypothetical protein
MDDKAFLDKLKELSIRPYFGMVYKYTSIEAALKIIANNTLRFSSPVEFNDPFELSSSLIDVSFTEDEIKRFVNRSRPEWNNAKRRHESQRLFKNPKALVESIQEVTEDLRQNIGICCFSEDNSNTLMWSHYADHHKGVCLGFIFKVAIGNETMAMAAVGYADSFRAVNFFSERDYVIINWTFTKSHVWSYEKEVRIINDSKGFIPFEKSALKELYFGLRTSESERTKILEALNSSGYAVNRLSTMEINKNTWDLMSRTLDR